MEIFAKRLADLRKIQGVSRETLAERIGASPMDLARWEANVADPTTGELVRVSRFFDVSLDYLLGFTKVRKKMLPVFYEELSQEETFALQDFRRLTNRHRALLTRTFYVMLYEKARKKNFRRHD